ncbi:ABC transporter permease [Microvirga massiliensis]|uniref:ABC transporter permease n=1 Tax=Microvirga massiliensis TaxID=1033741 RepID=UPI00062B4C83|nr:ABC transporter permease [Microvirga massiliensis]
MRAGAYVRLALRSLRAQMLRSLLAVLGIVIGIAAVLIVVSVAEGARAEISRQIDSLGSNLLLIQPGTQREQGVRHEAGSNLTLTAADARSIAREISSIVVAAPYVADRKTAVAGNRNWFPLVAGVTPEYLAAREWKPSKGDIFSGDHLTTAAKVALIGHTVARELFPEGDAIGHIVRIEHTPYTVLAVLAEKGQDFSGRDQDDVVLVPLTTAKIFTVGRNQVNPDAVQSILVKTVSTASLSEAEKSIGQLLRLRHRITERKDDDFRILNLVQVTQARDQAYRQFTLLVSILAGISLLVGGIGVMNIMLVSVTERTMEVGIRLAVGARPRDIRYQFIAEASLLCTIGGILGLASGYAAARMISYTAGWPVEFNTTMALLAVACSTGIGLLFGLLPADRAARLDPAVVMRSGQ